MLLLFLLCLFYISRPKKRRKEKEINKIKIMGVNYGEIKRRAKKRKIEKRISKS